MSVRLSDQENGELFAECPLPADGTPLTTAVEPVLDSSRYFVLRVVDRETGKHAFIGLGFRERSDASGFTTGLDEYRRYLQRKAEADKMRDAAEQQQGAGEKTDFSLKQNITIQLKPVGSRKRPEHEAGGAEAGSGGHTEASATAAAAAASAASGVAALKLAPPPPAGPRLAPPLPPAPAAAAGSAANGPRGGAGGAGAAAGTAGAAAAGGQDDEWGDFTA